MNIKTLAACLLLLVATLANGFQTNAEWTKYTSAEGRYSVLLPQEPKLSAQEDTASNGEKAMVYTAQSLDSDSRYGVIYFDNRRGTKYSLDKGRDGMVAAVKGTLVSETAVVLEGRPGRELKIAAKNGDADLLIRTRIYTIGNRVYIIQHVFLKASDSPAMAEKTTKFFDSFKATEGK